MLYSYNSYLIDDDTYLVNNAYFTNGDWYYKANGYATMIKQSSGIEYHYYAATGIASAKITWSLAYSTQTDGTVTISQVNTPFVMGSTTNNTTIEADGSLVLNGTATVYNDLAFPITPKTTGVGKPTLTSFTGLINKYVFQLNDVSEVDSPELLHDAKEGSDVEFHVHWVTNSSDSTNRYVQWEAQYTWANMNLKTNHIQFATATTLTGETLIPANTPTRTHMYTSLGSVTMSTGYIGAYFCHALKRVSPTTNSGPSGDPFALALGIHYEKDTMGSRSISSK